MVTTESRDNLVGLSFGQWVVLKRVEGPGKAKWKCLCSCGTAKDVLERYLLNGDSKSCKGPGHKLPTTTPGYFGWASMIQRCVNPNDKSYARYGGRGIFVCDRWLESFANFYADMGPKPDGMSLDRIDNDGPYSPENCRWATASEQQNNSRRNIVVVDGGEEMTLSQLAQKRGVSYGMLRARFHRGKPL